MSPNAVADVDNLLAAIAREHGVCIPWAIESGSRAWGFPSPDSDYDGRFIYVRPAAQALTVWQRRDVIETPIVGDLDVNGWDLSKALRLILKGNSVVVEWLQSPIIYSGEAWFRETMLAFAETWLDRQRATSHYLHLSRRQRAIYLEGQAQVPLKKIFYALRPAVALRWMRIHETRALAPMHFPTLMAECDPPQNVAAKVAELISLKAVTREMGIGPMPPILMEFIDTELRAAESLTASFASWSPEAAKAADETFASITLRMDHTLKTQHG